MGSKVILTSFKHINNLNDNVFKKISAIKELRKITHMGLADAKKVIEDIPHATIYVTDINPLLKAGFSVETEELGMRRSIDEIIDIMKSCLKDLLDMYLFKEVSALSTVVDMLITKSIGTK
ncbi:MAG: ribosomal protein L7/L12 [Atribacterota bacterium]